MERKRRIEGCLALEELECRIAPAVLTDVSATAVEKPTELFHPQLYSADSPFNQPIDANPSIDSNSGLMVQSLIDAEQREGFIVSYKEWTMPIYYADANTPRYDVAMTANWAPVDVLENVPIPDFAEPDPEADGSMVIIDVTNGLEYDFWQARHTATGWSASWANVTSVWGDGIFPHGLSARGSGFALPAGMIWPDELAAGYIDHALVFSYNFVKGGGPVSPATESDGTFTRPDAIPEGARLQLDPNLDLDALNLTPYERTIARALQEYGMFLCDSGGGIQLYAVSELSVQGNPYEDILPNETYIDLGNIPVGSFRVLTLPPQDADPDIYVVPAESGPPIPGGSPPPPAPEIAVQVGATNITDGQATAISFGTVNQGQAGPTRAFTVRNIGTETLTLGTVSLPTGFTLTEGLSASLAGGASDTFTVRLDTATLGTKSGEITFTNNDADENPFNFSVTGTVAAAQGRILRAGDPVMRFSDGDDSLWVAYVGPGYAIITDSAGGSPDVSNTPIAAIEIHGSTLASRLIVKDLDPVGTPNTMTLGRITTGAGEALGSVEVYNSGGQMQNTDVNVGGAMITFHVLGDMSNDDLTVAGGLTRQILRGDATNCDTTVAGGVGLFQVIGDFEAGTLTTTGGALQIMVRGELRDSTVQIGGTCRVVQLMGGCSASAVRVGSDLGRLIVSGPVSDTRFDVSNNLGVAHIVGATSNLTLNVGGNMARGAFLGNMAGGVIDVGGAVTQALFLGGMTSSTFTASGNVTRFLCAGSLENSSAVHITGTTMLFQVTQGIKTGSTVNLDGEVAMASVFGKPLEESVDAASTVRLGGLRTLLAVRGDLAGTIDVTGSAAGSNIHVAGNLSGSLLAGVFGNVTVIGRFSGRIGDADTTAGTGNRLLVTQPGGGGAVTPSDAFARIIGLP